MRTTPLIYTNCDRCHSEVEILVGGGDLDKEVDEELTARGWLVDDDDGDYCDECRKEIKDANSTPETPPSTKTSI